MNSGKVKYDAIEIPASLGEVIDKGIERGRRRKRLSALRRTAGAAAAAVVILFAGANIAPVYSYAADIPVLGEIVRVLHVGSGGNVTDLFYPFTSLSAYLIYGNDRQKMRPPMYKPQAES